MTIDANQYLTAGEVRNTGNVTTLTFTNNSVLAIPSSAALAAPSGLCARALPQLLRPHVNRTPRSMYSNTVYRDGAKLPISSRGGMFYVDIDAALRGLTPTPSAPSPSPASKARAAPRSPPPAPEPVLALSSPTPCPRGAHEPASAIGRQYADARTETWRLGTRAAGDAGRGGCSRCHALRRPRSFTSTTSKPLAGRCRTFPSRAATACAATGGEDSACAYGNVVMDNDALPPYPEVRFPRQTGRCSCV